MMGSEHSKSSGEESKPDLECEMARTNLDWIEYEEGSSCSLDSLSTIDDFMEHESETDLLGNEEHKESSETIDSMKVQRKESPPQYEFDPVPLEPPLLPHDDGNFGINVASPTELLPPSPKDMSPGDENFFIDDPAPPLQSPNEHCSALRKNERLPPHIIKSEIGGTSIYRCQFCRRVFRARGYAGYHLYCKNSENKHKCEQCPESFSLKSQFKTHQATHESQKASCQKYPFECTVCQQKFGTKTSYQNHLSRAHSLKKAIPCDQIDKKFKAVRHQKRQHKEKETATTEKYSEASNKKNTNKKVSKAETSRSLIEKLMKAKRSKQKTLAGSSKTNTDKQQWSNKTLNSESESD